MRQKKAVHAIAFDFFVLRRNYERQILQNLTKSILLLPAGSTSPTDPQKLLHMLSSIRRWRLGRFQTAFAGTHGGVQVI